MDFYKNVGISTFDSNIKFWYDPSNGFTQYKKQWVSDDITDSNRAVFETLTATQRDAILAANDDTRVTAAGGVIATARLKHELRQYNIEFKIMTEHELGIK